MKKIKDYEHAFTLIEVIICLSVVLLITSFLPLVLKEVSRVSFEEKGINVFELDVFAQKLKYEVRQGKGVSSTNQQLTILKEDGRHITFEFYQDKIRRRVGGTGHVVVLQGVKSFEVQSKSYGALLIITGFNNVSHKVPIYPIINTGAA